MSRTKVLEDDNSNALKKKDSMIFNGIVAS